LSTSQTAVAFGIRGFSAMELPFPGRGFGPHAAP